MSNEKDEMKKEIRKNLLWPLLVGIILIIIGFIYTISYLEKVDLGYYVDTNIYAHTGSKPIDPNIPELTIDISKIKYLDKEFESLHLLTFRIINNSQNHLPEDAIFYIQGNNNSLPKESIIKIIFKSQTLNNEVIVAKSQPYDQYYGHNFKIFSALPGKSYLSVSVLIDDTKLKGIGPNSIDLKKATRKRENLQRLFSPESKITFTYIQFIVMLLLAAFCYGGFWLVVNIIRNRYSTGMEIIDKISSILFKRPIFRKKT